MGRFIYSTEVVTYLFCLIIYLFNLYNRPKKNKCYSLCIAALVSLWIEMSLECYLYMYVKYVPRPMESIINIFLVFHILSHFVMLVCLLFYVDELSLSHALSGKKILNALCIFFAGYVFLFLLLLNGGNIYFISGHELFIARYIVYVDAASIIGTLGALIYIVFHQKEFPRGLTYMMLYSMPVMIALQLLQFFRNEVIYHGIIYIIPIMIIYFHYHNNPYDQITGYQDASSFDSIVQRSIAKNINIHMIVLEIPRLKDYAGVGTTVENTDIKKRSLFVKACRNLEYSIGHAKLYRINDYTYGIIINSKSADKDEKSLEQVKQVLYETSLISGAEYFFNAVHFALINANKSFPDGFSQNFVLYMLNQFDSSITDRWIDVTYSDYQDFLNQNKIEQALINIANTHNLNDPRVICFAQPIYDVASKSYRTAEALMRMELDNKVIYPDKFIPLAEKHKCIHELTLIMLNKVCKYIKHNESRFDFDAITVNCSSIELSEDDLVEDVIKVITSNNINPGKIRIELTESAMFDRYDKIVANIKQLKDFGIKFYLDDFGTGYSNFERIMTCPLYTIKFDKSLLYKALSNESIDNMITSMISLFKGNGFNVLVEGVEDMTQRDYAVDRGFQSIQGYYFSKPVPIHDLGNFFTEK